MKENKEKSIFEKNFLVYLLGKGLSVLVFLLSIPILIKIYGKENYGNFILIYTTFLMFLSGSVGWINQSIFRYYSKFNDKQHFSDSIITMTIKASIIVGAFLVLIVHFQKTTFLASILIYISFIIGCIYTTKMVECQSSINSRSVTIAEFVRSLSYFVVPICLSLISTDYTVEKMFFGILIGYFLGFLVLTRGNFKIKLIKIKKKFLLSFLFYGMPLSIWMFFSPSTNGLDRYFVKYYLGAEALAQYSAVFDVVFKVFSQFSIPLDSIFQPLIMRMYNENNRSGIKETMSKAVIYLLSIFAVCLSFFVFMDNFIIKNYLGFNDASEIEMLKKIIIPIALAGFIWQLGIMLQKHLEANNKTIYLAVMMMITTVFSFILSLIFVPDYGYVASAYICLASSVLYLLFIYYKVRLT